MQEGPSSKIPNLARGPLQGRLFDPEVTEILRDLGIQAPEMEAWMQAGILSYDPRRREKLNAAEEAELTFVAAVARSGLSYQAMCRMLAPLEKPYAYWPSEVVWDFGQGKWRYLPGEIQRAVDEARSEWSEEDIEGHIQRLVEDGDLAALQTFLATVQEAIEEVTGTPGSVDPDEVA